MEVILPSGCGNAPRAVIVADMVSAWAAGETAAVRPWLDDHVTWTVMGGETLQGPDAVLRTVPSSPPERLEFLSVLTHGRMAACDGALVATGRRVGFCHMIRFTGAARTARIADVRTYLEPSRIA
ncbi:nuclear transport factor 2 family protein [Arthrobacter sp. JSM 101049]|uniref:nuclear transport factor 2 family protein n=1 Tax=Arthrobacter sp. JSM 101049 TaxID=929097 RepID=UPI00356893A3